MTAPLADNFTPKELAGRILEGWHRGEHLQPFVNIALMARVHDLNQYDDWKISRALQYLSKHRVIRYRRRYQQWELTTWRATKAGQELLDAHETPTPDCRIQDEGAK